MTTREQEPHLPRTDGINVSAFDALLSLRLPQKNRRQIEEEETALVAAVPKSPPIKSLTEPPSTPLGLATPLQARIGHGRWSGYSHITHHYNNDQLAYTLVDGGIHEFMARNVRFLPERVYISPKTEKYLAEEIQFFEGRQYDGFFEMHVRGKTVRIPVDSKNGPASQMPDNMAICAGRPHHL
jgi:hypothetical protein